MENNVSTNEIRIKSKTGGIIIQFDESDLVASVNGSHKDKLVIGIDRIGHKKVDTGNVTQWTDNDNTTGTVAKTKLSETLGLLPSRSVFVSVYEPADFHDKFTYERFLVTDKYTEVKHS
jgi:hypothetical protein